MGHGVDTYQTEGHPVAARVLKSTMAQTALNRGDDRKKALRETVADLLMLDVARKRYAAMMSGLDLRTTWFGPPAGVAAPRGRTDQRRRSVIISAALAC